MVVKAQAMMISNYSSIMPNPFILEILKLDLVDLDVNVLVTWNRHIWPIDLIFDKRRVQYNNSLALPYPSLV